MKKEKAYLHNKYTKKIVSNNNEQYWVLLLLLFGIEIQKKFF